VSNDQVVALRNRALQGNAAVTIVNIVKAGLLYYPRLNQFDVRVAKMVPFEQRRLNISVDIYNVLNSSVGDQYQQAFGSSWLIPLSIIPWRFPNLGVQFDF